MSQSAHHLAEHASFQAFLNCYLREVDAGVWHSASHWCRLSGQDLEQQEAQVIELQLPSQQLSLIVGVAYRSQVGRHSFTRVFQQKNHQLSWHRLDCFATLILLINEIYGEIRYPRKLADDVPTCKLGTPSLPSDQADAVQDRQLELLARLIESQQIMTRYLATRQQDKALGSRNFIDSEQSLLFGHWLHPTPKSRQGIHDWQHQEYAPELCGQFQLHYFAVDRSLVAQRSILESSTEACILQQLNEAAPALPPHQLLIPTHPLQAQWLLHQAYLSPLLKSQQVVNLGPLGPMFTATSSVRTVYSDTSDFMFKFSIPVKITNSLRINMQHELEAGLVVARLFRQTGFSERFPAFQMICDPAYISLRLPDRKESGFEVILRENPFKVSRHIERAADLSNGLPSRQIEQQSVHSIAALTQSPLAEHTPSRLARLIRQLARAEQRTIEAISLAWFDRYWACAIEPAIRLYDLHGIALEAHQQNSLLDVSSGYPTRYYFRDNQGFYLSASHKETLIELEPRAGDTEGLFYSDEMIFDRFTYYLVVNQLFSVINRFGQDGLLAEATLLLATRQKLLTLQTQLQGLGVALIDKILHSRELPCKGNLLTRIEDRDELQAEHELAVYTRINNQLNSVRLQAATAKSNAVHEELCLESA